MIYKPYPYEDEREMKFCTVRYGQKIIHYKPEPIIANWKEEQEPGLYFSRNDGRKG